MEPPICVAATRAWCRVRGGNQVVDRLCLRQIESAREEGALRELPPLGQGARRPRSISRKMACSTTGEPWGRNLDHIFAGVAARPTKVRDHCLVEHTGRPAARRRPQDRRASQSARDPAPEDGRSAACLRQSIAPQRLTAGQSRCHPGREACLTAAIVSVTETFLPSLSAVPALICAESHAITDTIPASLTFSRPYCRVAPHIVQKLAAAITGRPHAWHARSGRGRRRGIPPRRIDCGAALARKDHRRVKLCLRDPAWLTQRPYQAHHPAGERPSGQGVDPPDRRRTRMLTTTRQQGRNKIQRTTSGL